MEEQADAQPAADGGIRRRRLRKFTRELYAGLFLLTLVLAVLSAVLGEAESLILTGPVLIIMGLTIFTDRKYAHIPPALILMMIATFYLTVIGRSISDSGIVDAASMFVTGINFGLLGLIMVYMLLKSMPGVRDESPLLVAFMALAISVALFSLMKMVQFFVSQYWDDMEAVFVNRMMWEEAMLIIGSLAMCFLYIGDSRHRFFNSTLTYFLEDNSEFLGIEERERKDALDLIRAGESKNLEFKSTIRTNLETGEVDKRMEKAVLKTIVAFLNTDGGNLMIGVADDGEIIGADLHSFANKDKMGLHLTNMIGSQIGNSFLPYITFSLIDFDDKVVIWVKCLECPEPVFLKDGKIEIFYVRANNATAELTGMSLINYVNNRRNEMVRKGRVFD